MVRRHRRRHGIGTHYLHKCLPRHTPATVCDEPDAAAGKEVHAVQEASHVHLPRRPREATQPEQTAGWDAITQQRTGSRRAGGKVELTRQLGH